MCRNEHIYLINPLNDSESEYDEDEDDEETIIVEDDEEDNQEETL
jgi:hypothetical protein